MDTINKKRGRYLGTKINHHWWQRYSKGGFLTRGAGEYWIKDGSLFFQHQGRQKPINLPLQNLAEIKICPCHKQVGGIPVVKLIWEKDGKWLSSGFVLSGIMEKNNTLLTSLRTGI